ncbi:MAG: NAD(P) transhydrogenase subunit alpha [Elusimicrobiota bacterium]
MKIFVPKETTQGETRIPLTPDAVKKLTKLGVEIEIEAGLGTSLLISDAEFEQAGAVILPNRKEALAKADIVLRLRKPPDEEIDQLKKGAIHISYLEPFTYPELTKRLADAGASAICMELIPRSTIAQKMDAISSQANLAGYAAVVIGAEKHHKILPMMMTPAGTIRPARVFIIGVGVAGLQAIATAKRMGARVEAFDTRPVVEEQVKSLGAKFVKIDLGETGQTRDGYAKQLTPEQINKQREGMAKICAQSDIVITTAQVFGRKPPLLVTDEMLKGMQPSSVVIDMAAETGGNVEGSKPGEEVIIHDVRVFGPRNLPGVVPTSASEMYAANLANLIEHFWDKEKKEFKLDLKDEIIDGCLLTHAGEVRNADIRGLLAETAGAK